MKIQEWPASIQPGRVDTGGRPNKAHPADGETFGQVLKTKISQRPDLKFSAHAIERLHRRNINLTVNEIGRIQKAVEKIEQKGGNDSLVVMGDLALVVNVRNNTVITAMNKGTHDEDKVFTNIDSAYIL